jgi:hypothetical protein
VKPAVGEVFFCAVCFQSRIKPISVTVICRSSRIACAAYNGGVIVVDPCHAAILPQVTGYGLGRVAARRGHFFRN